MKLNLPHLYYYVAFAVMLMFFLLTMVPKRVIHKLFWFGMLWGTVLDLIVEHIYHFLRFIRYQYMEPFNIGYVPLWTILAWTPAIVMFVHFFPQQKPAYIHWLYLATWSVFITFVAIILSQLKLLVFLKCGPWIWFFTSFLQLYLTIRHYRSLENTTRQK